MYALLAPEIALRSWRQVPCAFYRRHQREAEGLAREQFELLLRCDGVQELPESALLHKLFQRGLAVPCEKGAGALTPWQRPLFCDNRYFPAMNWMITGRCNYNCRHCFNAADNAPLQSEWTLDEALALLEQAQQCGVNAFTITGGEPMLHPHFFEILEELYRRGMYVNELNTNGRYLTQQTLDRMSALGCAPLIKLSFDGLGWHNWMRGASDAEADALRAIRLCVDNGFSVMVQTNMNRKNADAMLATSEALDAMGVERQRIIRTAESPRWMQNSPEATLNAEDYFDAALKLLAAYADKPRQMRLDTGLLAELWPSQKHLYLHSEKDAECPYRDSLPVCRGSRSMVAVAADGGIYPCMQLSGCFLRQGRELGNVKKAPLQFYLSESRYLDFVCTTLADLAAHNPACAACPHFTNCRGGCRALAAVMRGDFYGCDPVRCLYWEKGYDQKIRALFPDWAVAPAL